MIEELQVMIVPPLLDHFGERLKAVVAFGSMATGEGRNESDLDLLVVATDLPKWKHRATEIVAAKRNLNIGRYVDMVLVTPEEGRGNFEGHNPLYLDIAFDGVVFYDQDFVAALMEETRAYVAARGIIRRKDGWKFPVEYRKETPLSKVTNGNWANIWIEDGSRDFESAKVLEAQELYEKAVYHCQQAVEKCIKAILICWGEFEKSHHVSDTLVECLAEQSFDPQWREKLRKVAEIGKELEPEVSLTRYPGTMGDNWWVPAEEYDEEKAEECIQKAESVMSVTKEFVDWWFHPEKQSEGRA